MSEEAGCRLGVDQFWPEILNFAGKNLGSLDGQKPRFCTVARGVLRPVGPCSSFSQLNCILGRETGVDREISMIDSLGVECRKREEKKKKAKNKLGA